MRILLVTVSSLIACAIIFWTIKFWGRSLHYTPYDHPLYASRDVSTPLLFIKPHNDNLESILTDNHNLNNNLYLNVASTLDQKLIVPKKAWPSSKKPFRYTHYEDIKNEVFLLTDLKESLAGKKIIINLFENAQAGHIIFYDEIKKMGWGDGENIIVTSPYEAMAKALKDIAPRLLFGSTQPEILRLVAMNSMGLIEAVTLRADIVIHPLRIKNQDFYDKNLLIELNHRYKKIIIGPLTEAEIATAKKLNPFGIIVEK